MAESGVDLDVEVTLESTAEEGLLVASISIRLLGGVPSEPRVVVSLDGKHLLSADIARFAVAQPQVQGGLFRAAFELPRSAMDGEPHELRLTVYAREPLDDDDDDIDPELLATTLESSALSPPREQPPATKRVAVHETAFYAGRVSTAIVPRVRVSA